MPPDPSLLHPRTLRAIILTLAVTGLVGTTLDQGKFHTAVVASQRFAQDDRGTGGQPNGDEDRLPEPMRACLEESFDCRPSEQASHVAGVARLVRITKDTCAAPFRRVVVPAAPEGDGPPNSPAAFKCVLDADATMIDTLEVASFTTIDCQDHRLTPGKPGVPGDLSRRSDPEVAFFLKEAHGVRIENCNIDGFDFGIFGLRNKVPPEYKSDSATLAMLRNRVHDNVINARFYPVYFHLTDNTIIENNTASFTSAGGLGISLFFDSDLNTIRNNIVTSNVGTSPIDAAPAVPGPVIPGVGSSNPSFPSGGVGIIAAHIAANPSLLTALIGGNLYQTTVPNSSEEGDRSESNVIEGNVITFDGAEGAPPANGIASSQAVGTLIRGNTIIRGNVGILLPGAVGMVRNFPGRCTADSDRLCLIDNDCNIPSFDTTSKGMCIGVSSEAINMPSRNVVLEQNRLTGLFSLFGIHVPNAASNVLIRNNSITGPAAAGIRLAGPSLQSNNTITGNSVSNVQSAVRLEKVDATSFASRFSLNDFTGYTTAVSTSNDYNLPSELSVNGMGNYWGLACPGFDPNDVRRLNGVVNPSVVDSHPFGVPVAGLAILPAPCE